MSRSNRQWWNSTAVGACACSQYQAFSKLLSRQLHPLSTAPGAEARSVCTCIVCAYLMTIMPIFC